jgi:O-acetyl-ADP-ribose deacetylase
MEQQVLEKIEITQGDITKIKADAIVSAANHSLLGGGGVDGAIHRAAGPELLEECKTIGGCPTGEARITRGYNLPAKYVIHTVGPVYSGSSQDTLLLSRCYQNSLKLALEKNIKTIAFPAISCGIYGYPIEEACNIALEITIKFIKENNKRIEKIVFVLLSKKDQHIYEQCLNEIEI